MRTELPAERLQRRLDGPSDDTTADDAAASDDESTAMLSRWLPQSPTANAQWWHTIRADPGRAGAWALGGVAVIAILVAVFTLMTSDTPPVVAANLPPVQMVSASPAPQEQASSVVVSVVGLVHKPGLVTLAPGARIADALAAAGGPQEGADVVGLNIAQKVTDGQQIVVGIAPLPGQPPTLGSSVTSESGQGDAQAATTPETETGLLDLNTATEAQLDELPGVGPVTAAAIVAWRDANGAFTSVDQLADVDGIGPARLDKLRDQVRV